MADVGRVAGAWEWLMWAELLELGSGRCGQSCWSLGVVDVGRVAGAWEWLMWAELLELGSG